MGRYLPQLDGLRALAILLVIGDHTWVLRTGYLGVDVFFVLSGYLITTILLNERDRDRWSVRGFYVRRMRRLYPALSLMLVLTLPLDPLLIHGTPAHRWLAALSAATYTSAFPVAWNINWMGGLAHTWSLSVEEQFYLLWPLGLIWFTTRRNILYLLTLALLSGLVLHPAALMALPIGSGGILLLGCILALWTRGQEIQKPGILATVSAGTLALVLAFGPRGVTAGEGAAAVLAGLATAGIIGGIVQGGWAARVLSAQPLVWVGRRSYGIYLWHVPLLTIFMLPPVTPMKTGAAVALSFGCAALSYRFWERRFAATPTEPSGTWSAGWRLLLRIR